MTKVHYRIRGYGRAQEILDGFSTNERYLRSLVANVTGDGDYADGLDYSGLISEGRKIRGIAKRILRSKASRLETRAEQTTTMVPSGNRDLSHQMGLFS